MDVQIPLTKPQRQFVHSEANHPAMVAGLGAGKSRAATMRIIILMLSQHGINTVYGMPSYDLLRLRAIPGVQQDLETIGIDYKLNKSTYTITVFGYGDIIFRSYDRPESWIAFECAHGVLDELDVLNKEKASYVWRKATERIRQQCEGENTLAVVTTPDAGIQGFVYEKWVKKRQQGYELIKASTNSNPYLPEGYVDQILANYDPVLANLYIDGEFVSLTESKVYHFFDRKKHHTDRQITRDDRVLHIGLDFNIGGCCAVAFIIEKNNPIAVDEFVSHDTQDFINNLTRYKDKKVIIYPDSSGKQNTTNSSVSDIGMIKNAGYQLSYKSTNPHVRDRINAYNALLAHDRFLINTDKCSELTNALETQGYDKKGNPEKFDDHPSIDDFCDASGYFIYYKYNIIRNIATSQSMY